mgnify:CR=1 FL=1
MQTINGTGGLCMTCNNSATCYHYARRGPALFCEMFDNYVATKAAASATLPETPPQLTDEKYAGLCMNCDHRMECRNAKTETGIWHCENYA